MAMCHESLLESAISQKQHGLQMEANPRGCEIPCLPLSSPKVRRDALSPENTSGLVKHSRVAHFPYSGATYILPSERRSLRSDFAIKMRPQACKSNFPCFYIMVRYNAGVVPVEPDPQHIPRKGLPGLEKVVLSSVVEWLPRLPRLPLEHIRSQNRTGILS